MREVGMEIERMTQRDDVASSRPGTEPVPFVSEAWNSNHFTTREVPWLSMLNIACVHVDPRLLIYPSPPPLVHSLRLWICFCLVNKFICIIISDSTSK